MASSSINKSSSNIFSNYVKNLSQTKTDYNNIKVVFKNKNDFLVCNLNQNFDFNFNKQCKNTKFDNKEIRDLLEGNLVKNKDIFQYVGDISILDDFIKNHEVIKINRNGFNFVKIDDSKLFYKKGIKINYLKDEKILNIYQDEPEARHIF